jgi:hypothetical protein
MRWASNSSSEKAVGFSVRYAPLEDLDSKAVASSSAIVFCRSPSSPNTCATQLPSLVLLPYPAFGLPVTFPSADKLTSKGPVCPIRFCRTVEA